MNLIVSAVAEPQTLLLLAPLAAVFLGLGLLRRWRARGRR